MKNKDGYLKEENMHVLSSIPVLIVVSYRLQIIRIFSIHLHFNDKMPWDHDLANEPSVWIFIGPNTKLFSVDEENIERLVCASKRTNEDTAIGDCNAQNATKEGLESGDIGRHDGGGREAKELPISLVHMRR